jgi:hypothetical protein
VQGPALIGNRCVTATTADDSPRVNYPLWIFIMNISLQASQHLRVRADVFNLLNQVNFSNPDNNINSPTFGRITSADIPHQIQLSVRYRF